MAASLGMLKSLPCPAGSNCTAFQCLFKHPSDDAPSTAAVDEGQLDDEKPSPAVVEQDSPRKRVKLTTKSPPATVPAPKIISNTEGAGTEALTTPVSPPPIKRNRVLPVKGSEKAAGTLTNQKIASPSIVKSAIGQSPPQVPIKTSPAKPETLNPRHLKRAPARHDIRFGLVKLLHAQYERLNNELKSKTKTDDVAGLIMSQQQLITKTLDDEEDIATKKSAIYDSVLKNKIMSYRKMSVDQWKAERTATMEKESGTSLPEPGYRPVDTGLSPIQEVAFLPQLSTPLKGLEQYGYISSIPEDEDVKKAREAVEASGNNEICDRCTRRFTVFPGRREEDGALASGGPCVHHPGKTYFVQGLPNDRTSGPKKWRCCDQTVGDTDGCVTGKHHVFKTTDPNRLASVLQFAETPPNPDVPKDRAVCFDCEMGYTVYGMELIRLTAVSWPSGDVLLDVLVYPVGEYIDLNSRYSGVRPEDMAQAERWKPGDDPAPTPLPATDASGTPQRKLKIVPSPKDARDLFFKLISPDTPLIGHGLENDLNALRVVHPSIVDTILLFPHKRGLPIRNGLKWLMETILGRKIQVTSSDEDEPQGHDSAEDARAAGELVRLKVRNEWRNMRMKGWIMAEDGKLTAPDDGWTVVGNKKT